MLFKAIAVFITLLFTCSTSSFGEGDYDWLNASGKVIENAGKQPVPEWLKPSPKKLNQAMKDVQSAQYLERAAKEVSRVYGGSASPYADSAKKAFGKHQAQPLEKIVCITFTSDTEAKKTLRILKPYKNDKTVRIALSGLPEGCKTFTCAIAKFHNLGIGNEFPSVTLDPKLFREHNVHVAPTILYLRKGKEVARVEGLVNPDWLAKEVEEQGEKGDLGRKGPVTPIQEKNLMDEIRDRINGIDAKKMIAEATNRFWHAKKYVELKPARKDAVYHFTPVVRAQRDITDRSGRVLVKAGTTKNPLEVMPIHKALIIYNPLRDGEREKAMQLYRQFRSKHKIAIYVITRPEYSSFDSVFEEQNKVKARVYLLDKHLAERLHIKHTITTVSSKGNALEIKEYAIK